MTFSIDIPFKARAVAAARQGITVAEYDRHLRAEEKWCTGCKAWHPRPAFGRDRSRTDGLQTTCRSFRKGQSTRVIVCASCQRSAPAHKSGTWCAACYQRWDRAGRPAGGPPAPRPVEEVNADRRAALARGNQTQIAALEGRLEDCEFLLSAGETNRAALARRLSVKPSTVERYEHLLREQVSA